MIILFYEVLERIKTFPLFLVDVVLMDVEITWARKCVIFAEDYVGLEGNKPSRLKPSWRPHHHGGVDIRSVNRGL